MVGLEIGLVWGWRVPTLLDGEPLDTYPRP